MATLRHVFNASTKNKKELHKNKGLHPVGCSPVRQVALPPVSPDQALSGSANPMQRDSCGIADLRISLDIGSPPLRC
jgi:hypothetical protein